MKKSLERLGQRALFLLDPETAHGLSIAALRSGMPLCACVPSSERLKTTVCGLEFANPLGMAAGFDKNAEVPDALLKLGFGFVEVGTLTPRPQPGNEKPRIFRLTEDAAVINRLGFNNEGHDRAIERLKVRTRRNGIVGVNIGANKDSQDRIADYELGVRRFASLASYLAINISSPNTPGLRNLQGRESLAELLSRVIAARAETDVGGRTVPVFLKIAPDLHESDLEDVAAEVVHHRLDGVIVSNTTIARPPLKNRSHSGEAGGLSGAPLFERSTIALAKMRKLLGPKPALIGVGGVNSAQTALEKIRAGADLVELYTGMIYGGPSLPAEIIRSMAGFAEREGVNIRDLRDSSIDRWAEYPLNG